MNNELQFLLSRRSNITPARFQDAAASMASGAAAAGLQGEWVALAPADALSKLPHVAETSGGAAPDAIVARLNAELVKVARTAELAERLTDDATLMIGSTPEQFSLAVTTEAARWRKLVDETGMKLEH